MSFGDEHLGKAVAILRERANLSQKELAYKVGVKPNTMNQYERGRRSMSEEMVFKIAGELERDPIEIWDMAYLIFRFNYFRERAEREGVSVEELIARSGAHPSPEAILKLFDSLAANVRQLVAAVLPGTREGAGGLGMMKVVVQPRPVKNSKTRKAVGFSGKKPPRSPKPQ